MEIQQKFEHKINEEKTTSSVSFFQLQNSYIATTIKSGLLVIDQQRAHERILFDQFMNSIESQHSTSQQQLFPQTIVFSQADAALIKELKKDLYYLGFDIEDFGSNTFVVNGSPSEWVDENPQDMIESMLENYKKNLIDLKLDKKMNLSLAMARNMSIKHGKKLEKEEIQNLIDRLFACKIPYQSPSGKKVLFTLTLDELSEKFK